MIQLIPVVDYDYPGVWMEVLMAKQVSKKYIPDLQGNRKLVIRLQCSYGFEKVHY